MGGWSLVQQLLHVKEPAEPFLKWLGGKRWIAKQIASIAGSYLAGTYFEPFLGGGAVFFQIQPRRAVLSDINGELIDAYVAVRAHPEELIRRLKQMEVSESTYRQIRADRPKGQLQRAVRFLYLNRTAYAGMYRLNRKGEFNVPFGKGRTPEKLWKRDLLACASRALHDAELLACDFQTPMERAGEGDVVYCDPTYTVMHDKNGFVRYNESCFSWKDQVRLADVARGCAARGATVIVSNAHHKCVRDLYPEARILTTERMSRMSRNPSRRKPVKEHIIIVEPQAKPRLPARSGLGVRSCNATSISYSPDSSCFWDP